MIDEYRNIILELLKRTEIRLLEWHPTNIKNQFAVQLGDGKVVVDYFEEDDVNNGSPIFQVTFENRRGEPIENVGVSNLNSNDYTLFHRLWEEIKESYYLKRETISSIRTALGLTD